MRYLFFLLWLPLSLCAQNPNQHWITSIADVEFSSSKVIYRCSNEQKGYNDRIIPVEYDTELLEIELVINVGYLDADNFRNLVTQLNDYLAEWHIAGTNNREKHTFLKVCSILILWNIDKENFLPENTLENLKLLEADLFREVSNNAKLVAKLYQHYNEN